MAHLWSNAFDFQNYVRTITRGKFCSELHTCLPDHLCLLSVSAVRKGASRRDADGAVAAADAEPVRRHRLDGQRVRVAAQTAQVPLHLQLFHVRRIAHICAGGDGWRVQRKTASDVRRIGWHAVCKRSGGTRFACGPIMCNTVEHSEAAEAGVQLRSSNNSSRMMKALHIYPVYSMRC